jgi:hypothetical protein
LAGRCGGPERQNAPQTIQGRHERLSGVFYFRHNRARAVTPFIPSRRASVVGSCFRRTYLDQSTFPDPRISIAHARRPKDICVALRTHFAEVRLNPIRPRQHKNPGPQGSRRKCLRMLFRHPRAHFRGWSGFSPPCGPKRPLTLRLLDPAPSRPGGNNYNEFGASLYRPATVQGRPNSKASCASSSDYCR